MPIVLAENLTKDYQVADKQPGFTGTLRHFFNRQYRKIQAVKSINFQIERGEIVGFLGPNGAGKTTTMKMLTGLIHPSAGQLKVGDFVPWQRKTDFLRKITLVIGQKQQLLWDLPALDSLKVNAAIYEIDKKTYESRIGLLKEMLGIKDGELTQPIRKLSLGQRMKAELLAALLHQPEILFLDEPTLGLDINAQSAIRTFLKEYNQAHQATILLSSHYMIDITSLCERVLLIHEGELMHDGSLSSLTNQLAPYREVHLDFESPVGAMELDKYGDEITVNEKSATMLIERSVVASTVEALLERFNIVDMKIGDPPIDHLIGRLYQQGLVKTKPETQDNNALMSNEGEQI